MKNRKKSLLITIVIVIAVLAVTFPVLALSAGEENIKEETLATTSEVYIPSETTEPIEPEIILEASTYERINTLDLKILYEEKEKCVKRMEDADKMESLARDSFKYNYKHPVRKLAKKEYAMAYEDYKYYNVMIKRAEEEIEKQKWDSRKKEYPIATEIWLYLKNLGYNDYVCAGIMGNMMAETSGGTLNIRAEIYDASKYFYGVCQWSTYYAPSIGGKNLQEQLNYLAGNIKSQLDTYGFVYHKGFNYEKFLLLENEKDVALAFAKTYERCASFSYGVRQTYATKAYNYFTTK